MRVRNAMRMLPGMEHMIDDLVHTYAMFNLRKNKWPIPSHLARIARHDIKISSDSGREIGLINYKQIGLRDARTALARNLVSTGHVDHIDRVIGEFAAEVRRQIIAAGFDQENLRSKLPVQFFQRQQIRRNILANSGVWTTTCFHGADSLWFEGAMPNQEFTVFLGKNIICHSGQSHAVPQALAKRKHERGLSASHWAAHANGKRASAEIAFQRHDSFVEVTRMIEMLVRVAMRTVLLLVVLVVHTCLALKKS